MNLLYIGNNLKSPRSLLTETQNLGEAFRKIVYNIKAASDKTLKFLRLVEMLRLIERILKTSPFFLIDTYGALNFYYAYLVAKACQFYKLDYIPILHGGNLPTRLGESKGLSHSLFGNAKMNVAPSQFLYRIFNRAGFDNLQIIPNAIELNKFPFKKRKSFLPKMLWVRRFQGRYNPMMAIKVLEQLKKEYPSAELCMVGPEKDGSLQKCKEYAEKHDLKVIFTGKLKKKEWAKVSADYDIFLNSTNIDNTPISVIEAMALGLAIVSTDVGGMKDLIDHQENGVLVPWKNERSMVKAVKSLLEDQIRTAQMTLNAREKVSNFDWEKVKHNWNELLN